MIPETKTISHLGVTKEPQFKGLNESMADSFAGKGTGGLTPGDPHSLCNSATPELQRRKKQHLLKINRFNYHGLPVGQWKTQNQSAKGLGNK